MAVFSFYLFSNFWAKRLLLAPAAAATSAAAATPAAAIHQNPHIKFTSIVYDVLRMCLLDQFCKMGKVLIMMIRVL